MLPRSFIPTPSLPALGGQCFSTHPMGTVYPTDVALFLVKIKEYGAVSYLKVGALS